MTHALEPFLPRHERFFYPSLAFGIADRGYTSVVNLFNYYGELLFGADGAVDAVAEIGIIDRDGRSAFLMRALLAPNASLHLDVAATLRDAGWIQGDAGTICTLHARLIPVRVPARLAGKRVSTEYTVEHVAPDGSRDIIHNTGAPTRMPSVNRRTSDMIFSEFKNRPIYLVLSNNYWGPRFPFVSDGFALVEITNSAGRQVKARTPIVPARGLAIVSFQELFPRIHEFLDESAGILRIESVNLLRKPWVWCGNGNLSAPVALEHI